MKVIPAVDLKEGVSVRLYQGKADTAKVYYTNPVEAAKKFESEGAELIHVVDLDAAMGRGDNSKVVLEIVKNVDCRVEVGGGIRGPSKAKWYLDHNVERVVLGTITYRKPEVVRAIVDEYGSERVVAAVDHLRGEVKVRGWLESTEKGLSEYLRFVEDLGVGYILLSSIEGDGTLKGPDYETISEAVKMVRKPIIAAGGISSIEDIKKLSSTSIYGVIVGRALYEGVFSLKEALKAVEGI